MQQLRKYASNLLVAALIFCLGALFGYLVRMYPRTGLAILIDDIQVEPLMTYEQVIAKIGPEQGSLTYDIIARNMYIGSVFKEEPDTPPCNSSATGGRNLFWLNKSDGRVWNVVTFDAEQRVVCNYPIEISNFIE